MKELSLNILDIAKNSVKAGADQIEILLAETDELLAVTVKDNGCGMTPEFLASVTDPFTTTRTTRRVGLGIPLFKLASEQTGGTFHIASRDIGSHPEDHGTETGATFFKTHIDCAPLGDVVSSVVTLIQADPDIRWIFIHTMKDRSVRLDTNELKAVLGDVPLNVPEVIAWIGDYLKEQYDHKEG
ncbi:MAG: sensor histidine kinase [Clostridia bacterium]|nr:sensor histidine kinase [Clostridia bacterium]MBQ9507414.1 sensor histidine kinase [Clostridia bacterium]